MIFVIVILAFLGFAFAEDLDSINNVIKNPYVDTLKTKKFNIESDIQDRYYRQNADKIKETLNMIDKQADKIKKNFKPAEPDDKAVQIGTKIKKDLSQDETFQKWIYNLTRDIFYKDKDRNLTQDQKKQIKDFASYVYFSLKNTYKSNSSSERIYIFMSSSVPKSVWKSYVKSLRMINSNNIYIVLRGCIGPEGCTYLKPTLKFIKEIAYLNEPSVDTTKPVNIIIDPYLFRYYNIKVVPSFVYAKGVIPKNPGMTEGIDKNLKSKVKQFYLLKGDVSIDYFVSKLIDEYNQKSEFLRAIRDTLLN